jgi:hypothetical protein
VVVALVAQHDELEDAVTTVPHARRAAHLCGV